MKPDQERVKNLLIDTVTLLCKNSLQFVDELHVEGLLGVSVDKRDVFFVHISKEFSNSPTGGASVTHNDSVEENSKKLKEAERSPPTPRENESINIKSEIIDEEECSIVDDPSLKLEGIASPAQMVAGQRRPQKRHSTQYSSQSYSGEDSNLSEAYSMGEGDYVGEPASKRRNNFDGEGGDDGGGDEGQSWPNLSGYDPTQTPMSQTFQETDGALYASGGASQQPGCSSWSSPGPSDSILYFRRQQKCKSDFSQVACSTCGKTFPSKWKLDQHMRIHSGEKPFVCGFCTYSANVKGNLVAHMKRAHNVA